MTSLDLWVVAAYLAASLVVGMALARRASGSLEDFFVGGRSLPWWLAGTSMAATTFSIDTPLYVAGVVGTRGIAGNWEWWSFGVAHVILLYVFARLWRRAEVVTDNELSELRYGGRPAAILRGVKGFLFAGVMGPIGLSLSMLAMVKVVDALEVLPALGLSGAQDRLWVVVGVSAVVLVYAGISGLWGVVVTDFVQFVLGMAGALLVAVAAVSHVGGLGALVEAAGAVEGVDLLAFTPLSWGGGGRIVWSTAAGISSATFMAYVGLQWWAFRRSDGGGEFVQRLAAARSEAEAQKAAWLFNLLHYVVRTWPWIIVALAAVVLYPDLADPELGYPRLMLDFLPAGILGLVVASLVAAFMSTVSTTINWSASYLTHDLYVRFLRPGASSRERVLAARVASVAVTALGAVAAFYSENVTTLFRLIIAVGTGPGLVLILRWFWWRINAWAELAAMLAGFLVGLLTSVVPVLTISDFGLRLLVTAALTTAVWVPVMFLTAPEAPERLDTFFRKVRPGGPGWQAQRRRTGVSPDRPLASDLARVGAGLLILFGAMFAVGGALLLRPGVAAASVAAVVVGTVWLRRTNRRSALAAALLVGLLIVAAAPQGVAAQVVEVSRSEGVGLSLTRWLTGRFAGLQVLQSSGTWGSGARLRLRGPGSLSVSNEPLVLLDGMRIESGVRSSALSVGGQSPSRLDDIPLTSLARVELVRGPRAAALYGAGGAAGVLLLTSRAGSVGGADGAWRQARASGQPAVSAWVEGGWVDDVAHRPANWFGKVGPFACFAFEVALGDCEQSELQVYSPLAAEISTPFRTGATAALGARGAFRVGGADVTVGLSHAQDEGVLGLPAFESSGSGATGLGTAVDPDSPAHPSGGRHRGLDAGARIEVGRSVVRVFGALVERDIRRPFDGNDFAGIHAAGLLGFAEGGADNDYGYRLFRPSEVFGREVEQRLTRATGGVSARVPLGERLAVEATVGLDRVVRIDAQHVPQGLILLGASLPRGIADHNRTIMVGRSAALAVAAPWRRGPVTQAVTTLSVDGFASRFERTDLHGEGLAVGARGIGAAVDVDRLELDGRQRIVGAAMRQALEFGPGLGFDAGVRVESVRTLDRTLASVALPWVEIEARPGRAGPAAAWWPRGLVLRAGWGRGSAVPTDDGRDLDRVVLSSDAPDPPLERSTTWQVGAGVAALAGRVDLDLVRYVRTTDDLLLRTPLLFSLASAGARYDAVGSVENRGWEATATARILDRGAFAWSLDARLAFNDNEVSELRPLPGATVPSEIRQGVQWTVPGYPLGAYWDRPLTWSDTDGDGLLVPSEINVAPDAQFLGSPHPTREVSLGSRLDWGPLSLRARLLHRGGHYLRNLTESYRCQVTLCRGFNDPTAPLADQARAQPLAIFPADFVTEAGFIEDASFWRLDEAALTWRLPGALTPSGSAHLTLMGHNLATWTGYSGMDPDVNQFGASELLVRDFMTQPPVRRFTLRVDLLGGRR